MTTRRLALQQSAAVAALLAAAGLLPAAAQAAYNKAAFDAKNVADVLKALGAGAPVESKEVTITGPDIAENGAVVPLGAATTLAGVKKLLVLVEKNPNTLVAAFDVSDAVEPNFLTRAKLGQSSDVYAVAVTGDGKAFYAKKEVKVTLGGCGG
ncbi:sulfur oxidation protein SoxY [Delftia tsuruhatensis]|uniref:thiosulfate oxidation carrier protein SoxY n=1 Tax=Delftia tsuruhatensis TaxID=180282 RepID=UPI001E7A156F|nr:thiosulfate oxidation carrier protein SoxY [Delftia tsuruhatensis]CAB5722497.1 sulfur oxidation protein SoxY [Delftia tsuruhatensis]CAC9688210.1 sulfur oxidation protein SoxY [Delftia tsuruhatensis]